MGHGQGNSLSRMRQFDDSKSQVVDSLIESVCVFLPLLVLQWAVRNNFSVSRSSVRSWSSVDTRKPHSNSTLIAEVHHKLDGMPHTDPSSFAHVCNSVEISSTLKAGFTPRRGNLHGINGAGCASVYFLR